jgi:hypothetical protein
MVLVESMVVGVDEERGSYSRGQYDHDIDTALG